VVLADEPTGNLDQATGQEIMALLGELNRARGVTLVVITHDPSIAAAASRRIELCDGRVVSDSRANAVSAADLASVANPVNERPTP
jgi:predicted ABC-type transport system involved in lysophospholipase L1 biosynthesis ATPase subunit